VRLSSLTFSSSAWSSWFISWRMRAGPSCELHAIVLRINDLRDGASRKSDPGFEM
jgi:hypothetical protein